MDPEHCQLILGANSPNGNHRVCLETSFTSLQSPTVEVDHSSLNSSQTGSYYPAKMSPIQLNSILYPDLNSRSPTWNNNQTSPQSDGRVTFKVTGQKYKSSFSIPQANFERKRGSSLDKVDLIHDDWFGLAPLASPESLSEVSSISSRTSFGPNLTEVISGSYELRTPTIMRRTPKIPGNLSTCADDIRNVRYYQKLAKTVSKCPSHCSSESSDLSYESAVSKSKFAYLQTKKPDLSSTDLSGDFVSAENILDDKKCESGCPNCTCKNSEKCCENYDHNDCVFDNNEKSFSTSSEVPTSAKSSPEKPQLLETHFDHNFYVPANHNLSFKVYNPNNIISSRFPISPQVLSPTSPQIDQDVISNFAIDLNLDPEHRSIVPFNLVKPEIKNSPSVDSGSICKTPSESKTVSFNPQLVNLDPSMIQTDKSDLKSIMKETFDEPRKKERWFLLPKRSPKKTKETAKVSKRQRSREDCFSKNESLPLLSGLNSNAEKTSPSYVRRKKYVYPMTKNGRGESSV